MMSTECVPLSMSTPPPAIAGSAFQRSAMSTRDVNDVLEQRSISPRMPEVDDALGPDHVVDVAELRRHREQRRRRRRPRSIIVGARSSSRCASGFSHSTWMPALEEVAAAISACVAGGVQMTHGVERRRVASASASAKTAAPSGSASGRAAASARTSATAVELAPRRAPSNACAYDWAMPPAPTSPNVRIALVAPPARRVDGRGDRVGEVVDVLVGVALVPRQHEHAVEEREGAGEALGGVVDGLGPGERERPAARAERPLVAEDRALERRLLDVARRRRRCVQSLSAAADARPGRPGRRRGRRCRRSSSRRACRPARRPAASSPATPASALGQPVGHRDAVGDAGLELVELRERRPRPAARSCGSSGRGTSGRASASP